MRVIGRLEPDWSERLWRYFKIDRFVSLTDTGTLYFASARQFEDKFEGAVAVMPPGFPVDPRYAELDHGEHAFEQLKRLTKVNCWHRAAYESDAMWQLYAGKRRGVAICTTPERIRAAAKPFRLKPGYGNEDLWCGNVEYVDLLENRMNVCMLDRFFYKHMAFSWEREFRLAVSVRQAEEYGVQVPELGIEVMFDLDILIEKIFLGPLLSESDIESVRNAASRHGFANRICMSSLLGQPRYT